MDNSKTPPHSRAAIEEQQAKEPPYVAIFVIGIFVCLGGIGLNDGDWGLQGMFFMLLVAWIVIMVIVQASSKSERMKSENTRHKISVHFEELEVEYEKIMQLKQREEQVKQRKEQALKDAKETIWRSVDPDVKVADRPSEYEVQRAHAYIVSQRDR